MNTAKTAMECGVAYWQGSRRDAIQMNVGTEPKLAGEHAGLSTEMDNVLDSFAAEHDILARDIPFILHQPVPSAPMPAARGRARRAFAVLALLGIAGWGAYVYLSSHPFDLDAIAAWVPRASSPTDTSTTAAATAPSEARPKDPGSAVSPDVDRTGDAGSNASVANTSEVGPPAAAAPQTTGTPRSLASPVQNVAGEWRLNTQTETGDSSFQGVILHYEMNLAQDGDRVAGVGTKVSENENGIEPAAQTPVTMTGTIAGDRLTLNWVEVGTQPETRGRIVLLLDEAGTLRGRFSSNAEPSSGQVAAHRVPSTQ